MLSALSVQSSSSCGSGRKVAKVLAAKTFCRIGVVLRRRGDPSDPYCLPPTRPIANRFDAIVPPLPRKASNREPRHLYNTCFARILPHPKRCSITNRLILPRAPLQSAWLSADEDLQGRGRFLVYYMPSPACCPLTVNMLICSHLFRL